MKVTAVRYHRSFIARQLARHGSPPLGTVPRWRRPVSCPATAVPGPLSPLAAVLPPPALPSQTGTARKPAVNRLWTLPGPLLLRCFRLDRTSPPPVGRLDRSTGSSCVNGCTGVRSIACGRSGTAGKQGQQHGRLASCRPPAVASSGNICPGGNTHTKACRRKHFLLSLAQEWVQSN